MTNAKISALTSATTPLAGTEVLPVVQSSATTQVTVANLTAGRAVATGNLSVTGTIGSTGKLNVGTNANTGTVGTCSTTQTGNSTYFLLALQTGNGSAITTNAFTVRADGNVQVTSDLGITAGNIVPATAAKGINFTANTPAAGMTSQLLNWYEEGTWTPTLGGTATYTARKGKYTRVGRMVTILCDITVNVIGTGITTSIDGLPFSATDNYPIQFGYFTGLSTPVTFPSGFVGGTVINFYGLTVAGTTSGSLSILTSGTRVMISSTYAI